MEVGDAEGILYDDATLTNAAEGVPVPVRSEDGAFEGNTTISYSAEFHDESLENLRDKSNSFSVRSDSPHSFTRKSSFTCSELSRNLHDESSIKDFVVDHLIVHHASFSLFCVVAHPKPTDGCYV